MKQADPEELLKLALDEKLQHSKRVIKEALTQFSHEYICIAWTGGKDSTTMLWLWRETCKQLGLPTPTAMFIDEGDVFEEIVELVDRVKNSWNVEVAIAKNSDVSDKVHKPGDMVAVADLNERNRREIEEIGFTADFFPFHPESFVCNHLMKTIAMKVFMEENDVKALSTGIRWDEQDARIDEKHFSLRVDPVHTRIHPILHFKERDIWNTIHAHNIPFCTLYFQGYRSLGAKGHTFKNSDIPAWEQDLDNSPERAGRDQSKEEIMERLRSLGYM